MNFLVSTGGLVPLSLLVFIIVVLSPANAATVCGCPANCPVCEPLQVGMDASLSKSVLEYGESANVSVLVRNSEPNITSLGCSYEVEGQSGGGAPNVTNDGQWHPIGMTQVTAPQAPLVDHQVGVSVAIEANCTAALYNESGAAWCGSGCSSFTLSYFYPGYETIAEYRQVQLDAVNKMSLAGSAVGGAQSMVSKAESANSNSPYLNSSREKLAIAEDFLTSASFMYDQLAFGLSVNNSESAIAYANEAEFLAYLAYGVASPSTAYSYVLRLIEETEQRGGHTYDEIRQITDTISAITGISGGGGGSGTFKKALEDEKKDLDEANRLLEEARKKLKEGDYTGAAESALAAKTLTEKAREVLDSLFLAVKNGFVIAIENTYKSLLAEMARISARMDAASRQTGINIEEIKFGRNSIDYARFKLIRASALVKLVESASDVPELLKSSSYALIELRSARSYVQDAALHSYLSFMKRYTAIGIISLGAALLGVVIWWIEKKKEWAGPKPTAKEASPAEMQKPVSQQGSRPDKTTGESMSRPAKIKVRPSRPKQRGSRPAKKKKKTGEGTH